MTIGKSTRMNIYSKKQVWKIALLLFAVIIGILSLWYTNDLVKDKFDFLNIDVEGMDLKVLKSINLNFYEPKLICIEVLNSKQLDDLKKYLKKFGYIFIKKLGPSYFFSSKNHS